MALSNAELESLRFHLGYGNLSGFAANTYTPDGFVEMFQNVVAPTLTGDVQTNASTTVGGDGSVVEVTPDDMTDIVVNARLVIDVGASLEMVVVQSVTLTTFRAAFAKAHPSTGYPVALLGGHARVRILLSQAEAAWQAMMDPSIGDAAGLRQVDKGDAVWFEGFQVLKDRLTHYKSIVQQLARLIRVQAIDSGRSGQLEAY